MGRFDLMTTLCQKSRTLHDIGNTIAYALYRHKERLTELRHDGTSPDVRFVVDISKEVDAEKDGRGLYTVTIEVYENCADMPAEYKCHEPSEEVQGMLGGDRIAKRT